MSYFLIIILSIVIINWLLLGWLTQMLIKKDIVDRPNERTLHQGVVPRGGGLIIIATLLISLVGLAIVSGQVIFYGVLFILTLAWASLSWCDDKYGLSPRFRLLIQLILSLITVLAYGWVDSIFSIKLLWFGPVISLIGLVWMANLYNFMDGLDGLAGSQSVIASLTLAFWFYTSGAVYLAIICSIVGASSYAFVLRNWSPAQIFMGDVGSITLGAFFGTLMIIGVSRYELPIMSFICLLGVFILDASITIIVRASRGEKIWLPHRKHYYQRLANIGYQHSKIALGGVVLMLLCSLISTIGIAYRDMMNLSIFGVVVVLCAAIVLVHYLESKQKN